jgi:MoxR-like ATPase
MSDIVTDPDVRLLEQTLFEVKKVIVGQDRLVERLLTALLAGGHCLLEGVPGVAKTLAAETLAVAVGGSFRRIQFTPTWCRPTFSAPGSTGPARRASTWSSAR